MFKHLIPFLLCILFLSVATAAQNQENFTKAYDTAEATKQQAAELGHEWRDTRKLLKRSKKAAEKGDFATAIALAEEAKQQSELAIEQAKLQAKTWQDAVPKNVNKVALTQGQEIAEITAESFSALYQSAEAERKRAAKLGHEWRDTRKLLKRAKKAADKGDLETAITLAQQAKRQSSHAIEQARLQTAVWQDAVPK